MRKKKINSLSPLAAVLLWLFCAFVLTGLFETQTVPHWRGIRTELGRGGRKRQCRKRKETRIRSSATVVEIFIKRRRKKRALLSNLLLLLPIAF